MIRYWGWSLCVLLTISAGALWWVVQSAPAPASAASKSVAKQTASISQARWVDEAQCQSCHEATLSDWQGSHHQMAMQSPSEQSVLGDFSGQQVNGGTESTQFLRQGDEYVIRTPGADGQPANFKVAYTFGLEPLQQYLLELPGGRLQAHGMAWDTEKQAWFHLYQGQNLDYSDSLHWTGTQQNANFMCIECHASDYKREYNAASNTFASRWQALGVGCQSCHGPASAHLDWASNEAAAKLTEKPELHAGLMGFGDRSVNVPEQEVEVCARCHSRRASLDDGYQHSNTLMDDFLPSLLSADLYEVDGKIKDEVFEYGSFKQSKMYAAGVVCSDCHNPHSGQLRASDNGVCTQCHNSNALPIRSAIKGGGLKAKIYDSPAHHNHPIGSAGAQCINCHMPGKLYMTNDLRHDHSFTSPNPVQALELGHTDACLGCHQDVTPDQLITQFQAQYPGAEPRDGGYARDLAAARAGKIGAAAALFRQLNRDDQPAIRVATLLSELPRYPSLNALQQLVVALQHPDPSVRVAAVNSLPSLASESQLGSMLAPLITDSIRAVRLAVAWQLAQLPPPTGEGLPAWRALQAEYEQVQNNLLERAEAHFNLAMLYQRSGRENQVEATLHEALKRDPAFFPALIMQAQWQEQYLQQPLVGIALLQEATKASPQEASIFYALGLALVRQGSTQDALIALAKTQQLAPDNSDYAYVLAVALHDNGEPKQARQLLGAQLAKDPSNRQLRLALVSYLGGHASAEAVLLMDELRAQNPGDPAVVRR
jgi:predicted CXXCH cytochrome family protein